MTPRRLLWAAMAAHSAGFAALSALRHRAFETGRFDLGNMVQAVWSTAHGQPLQMTSLQGEQVSRLGSHVDPLLAAFAPLWWVWPRAELLLTVQAAAVAIGALPVFWLARKHLRSERAALGFALAYLLYPPLQWATLSEFHPVTLSCPLLLFALWYLDEGRLALFALFALVAVLGKEEVGLVVAAVGLWYALGRRQALAGTAIVVAGFMASLVAVEVIVPHVHEGASPFYGRYEEVGGSPGGILETIVTDPGRVLSIAFDERGLRYLAAVLVPLAGLALVAPLAALVAAPELALNLLSSVSTQTSVEQHYAAGVAPGIVFASILGAARLTRGRLRPELLAMGVVVVAVAANVRLGALPLWGHLPGGSSRPSQLVSVSAHDDATRRVLARVPAEATVSATNTLGAHLSARRRLFSFPRTRGADWVAIDETRLSVLDRASAPHDGRRALAALRASERWQLVAAEDGVLLFRRVEQPSRAGSSTSKETGLMIERFRAPADRRRGRSASVSQRSTITAERPAAAGTPRAQP